MASDLEKLQRWEASGGTWRVLARTPDTVTIALLRCDGGEEADRLVTAEAGVLALTAERHSSQD